MRNSKRVVAIAIAAALITGNAVSCKRAEDDPIRPREVSSRMHKKSRKHKRSKRRVTPYISCKPIGNYKYDCGRGRTYKAR